MSAWHWLLIAYPWTVFLALMTLLTRSERRELALPALLWPVLLPCALLSDPLGYLFSTLKWWPQQARLIAMTEALLSKYPGPRRLQVESRLRHAGRLGRFILRRYYRWLFAESQRLAALEAEANQ